MNEALKNILERNSHRNLVEPIPSKDEMEEVFQAALRAPDHAWLRPSSFIKVSGDGLQKLSDIFVSIFRTIEGRASPIFLFKVSTERSIFTPRLNNVAFPPLRFHA